MPRQETWPRLSRRWRPHRENESGFTPGCSCWAPLPLTHCCFHVVCFTQSSCFNKQLYWCPCYCTEVVCKCFMPIKGLEHPGSVQEIGKDPGRRESTQETNDLPHSTFVSLIDKNSQTWTWDGLFVFFYEDLMKLMMGRSCMFGLLTLSKITIILNLFLIFSIFLDFSDR